MLLYFLPHDILEFIKQVYWINVIFSYKINEKKIIKKLKSHNDKKSWDSALSISLFWVFFFSWLSTYKFHHLIYWILKNILNQFLKFGISEVPLLILSLYQNRTFVLSLKMIQLTNFKFIPNNLQA